MASVDVVIVGLGAMGSAAAHHLARAGHAVLGVDRYTPPHALGSSHGESRVIREAYFEHPAYVPLVRCAFAEWERLERESGRSLYLRTGALMIGPPGGAVLAGSLQSAHTHRVPHEILSPREIRRRFPVLRPEPHMLGLLEHRGGVLLPEACVRAHLEGAQRSGAVLRFDAPLLEWAPHSDGVRVRTPEGTLTAGALVLAAGAWLTPELAGIDLRLTVERQVVHWLTPAPADGPACPPRTPVTLWDVPGGAAFYSIPDLGRGTKVALHHGGERTAADAVRREVSDRERRAVERLARRYLPGAAGRVARSSTCLYTNTPDGHFVIDRHPGCPRVILVSACSGHGFKFASAIGRAVAALVRGDAPDVELGPFTLGGERLAAEHEKGPAAGAAGPG